MTEGKKIIRCKLFRSNDAFVKWQEDSDVTIISLQPIASSINFEEYGGKECCMNGETEISIFVTYVVE
jgi:hypothetical protein